MEDYFCTIHGIKLGRPGFTCSECQTAFPGMPRATEGLEQSCLYVDRELRERGTKWVERYARDPGTYKHIYYFCHTCGNFMHHRTEWCHKCGGKRVPERLTYAEMAAKYPTYNQGC